VALESAQFVARHLAHVGYEYIVLDAGWFGDNGGSSMSVDRHGRLMPNTTFHPSSAGGKVRKGIPNLPRHLSIRAASHCRWHAAG
jgi:hypothetical protein